MTTITIDRALLEQVLVALTSMKHMQWDEDTHHGRSMIAGIRAALATYVAAPSEPIGDKQPADEPVDIYGILACNVECSIFEKHIVPVLERNGFAPKPAPFVAHKSCTTCLHNGKSMDVPPCRKCDSWAGDLLSSYDHWEPRT